MRSAFAEFACFAGRKSKGDANQMNGFENPELIERSRRFWGREPADRSLVGVLINRMQPLRHFPVYRDDGGLDPGDLKVDAFVAECERRHRASETSGGDAVYVAYPWAGLPWMGSIMGLPVRLEGGYAWSARYKGDWRAFAAEHIRWDNGWLGKMNELTRAAVTAADGRYPVGPCHLHGPVDIAAAMMGTEQLALAVYDAPQELQRLLDTITDAWLKVVDEQYAIMPEYDGGYWNGNQPLWSPGRNMFVPADAVSVLSPDTVEEFVTPRLRRIAEHLDYCIAHTHSTYLHAIDSVLAIEGFQAIQVGVDPDGPALDEVLPVMRRIQESRALIVAVCQQDPLEAARQAKTAKAELDRAGLCILSYLPTAEAARTFMHQVGK